LQNTVISAILATRVYFWFRPQLQHYTHTPVSVGVFRANL